MTTNRKALIDQFVRINSHTNLSAIRDPQDIEIKHIQDSLQINDILTFTPHTTLCDVGTGGGFPLLPIAIENPLLSCTGIDSTRKKIDAINQIIDHLHITNAKAIRTRAEQHTITYDYVTARAVGYIDKLLPQIHHLVKSGGMIILYKQYTPEEHQDIIYFSQKYHFSIQKVHKYTLYPGDITRVLYLLQKQ